MSQNFEPLGIVNKKAWRPTKLNYVGRIQDLIQSGMGKTCLTTGDPGEYRKVPSLDR